MSEPVFRLEVEDYDLMFLSVAGDSAMGGKSFSLRKALEPLLGGFDVEPKDTVRQTSPP